MPATRQPVHAALKSLQTSKKSKSTVEKNSERSVKDAIKPNLRIPFLSAQKAAQVALTA